MNQEKKTSGGQDSLSYEGYSVNSNDNESFQDISRENGGSSILAYFNIVCVIAGTGVLGLPYALKQGGWIGVFIIFLSCVMSMYTGVILVECLYSSGNARLNTYKDVATASFGTVGGWVTFFFNFCVLFGIPVLFMVLCGSNLHQLCTGTVAELSVTHWIILSCVIVAIPFVLVKSMKEVALMSIFGTLATAIVVLVVLIEACLDQSKQFNVQHNGVVWNQFPIALSTISFSFGGNVVYPHVEASMKQRKDWNKVLGAGLLTCAVMYLIAAISGYYVYGDSVISPSYNRIPVGVGRTVAVVLMTVHVLTAAPILLTSLSLDIEEMLSITQTRLGVWRERITRGTFRLLMLTAIGTVAVFVPHFDDLMSLLGAFANCGLVMIFPILFYLRLTGIRNKPWYELVWCAIVIAIGLVGLVFGTLESVQALVEDFSR
ncbi:transmembrane amino acid transporter protein-domain-containing protein [Spinellus fusiger]|nr:transmembrane amino acid transporter protein-domain-containing protein [Spinellus fusiger]